jgi:hypothetical protein
MRFLLDRSPLAEAGMRSHNAPIVISIAIANSPAYA